jgi:hypothetical protein
MHPHFALYLYIWRTLLQNPRQFFLRSSKDGVNFTGSSSHQAEANRTWPGLKEAYPPKAGLSPASSAGDKGMIIHQHQAEIVILFIDILRSVDMF